MSVTISQRENGRRRVVFRTDGESKTEQHHADEVNINRIIARYQKGQALPVSSRRVAYGDFTGVQDYHGALEAVREAEQGFMMLPSSVRKRFRNDPGELLAFLADPGNREEAEKLGLIEAQVSVPADSEPSGGSETPSDGQTDPDEGPGT